MGWQLENIKVASKGLIGDEIKDYKNSLTDFWSTKEGSKKVLKKAANTDGDDIGGN